MATIHSAAVLDQASSTLAKNNMYVCLRKRAKPKDVDRKGLLVCLFNNESGMRHIQSSFILEEKERIYNPTLGMCSPEDMKG